MHDASASIPFRSIAAAVAEVIAVPGDGGLTLRLYRLRAGRRGGPVVLWGHCGSSAAGSYLPLLTRLAADADVFAFDARGHGGSDAPQPSSLPPGDGVEPLYAPNRFARDVAAIARTVAALAPGRLIHYAAHSLNAAALLRLGACMPEDFAALPWGNFALFEPPLFPPPQTASYAEAREKNRMLIARTLVRRRIWAGPDMLVDYLFGRGIFAAFSREDLRTHIAATLRPRPDGTFELACSPEIEAAMYAGFGEDSTWRCLPRFPYPDRVHMIGGDPDAGADRDWVTAIVIEAAARLPGARISVWRDHGHFMVFGDPARAADTVRALYAGS